MSAPCQDFCCSDFLSLVPRPPQDSECNLANPIHPIFAKDNFLGFTNRQYAQIKPSLILASRCLQLDSMTDYVTTMTDGDMFIIDDHTEERVPGKVTWADVEAHDKANAEVYEDEPLTRIMRFPKRGQVIDYQLRSDSKKILKHMAKMVKFTWLDPAACSGENSGLQGCAQSLPDPLSSSELSTRFPRGVSSLIGLSRSTFQRMLDATRKPEAFSNVSPNYHQFMELRLAEILLHEFGHALQNATQGDQRAYEAYYKDSVACEAGFDLTARVFGGLYGTRQCHARPMAHIQKPKPGSTWGFTVLTPWPLGAGALAEFYQKSENFIDVRHPQEHYEIVTRLPPGFVAGMFREEFWTDVVPGYGSLPLIPIGAPKWILTSEKAEAAETTLDAGEKLESQPDNRLYISHLDDPKLELNGSSQLHNIIRRQIGYKRRDQKHDPSDILESVNLLWVDPEMVYGGSCKMLPSPE